MNNVYLSILVMSLLAGFLAAILSITYNKLGVKEDPKIKEIEELLPGLNCGACGLANCKQFAEKLANKGIAIDKCKITARNKETVEKINKILSE